MTGTRLLSLPAELRNQIYETVLADDLYALCQSFRPPSLLLVCKQLNQEYSDVFFESDGIMLEAYYPLTHSWCTVRGKAAKRTVLKSGTFVDLFNFSSLASAQRHCQRVSYLYQDVRRGIMTISINGSSRWWLYSVKDKVTGF